MKKAIVVGGGAGGATAAKELQGKFDVTVLEAGKEFTPFSWTLPAMEKLKKTGLLLDEREIQMVFPAMQDPEGRTRPGPGERASVRGVRPTSAPGTPCAWMATCKALGIDLDAEFDEIYREIPVTTAHQEHWRENTRHLFEICREMGLDPRPTPKMGDYDRCRDCGRCVLGCPHGVKWDSRRYLAIARERGARVITGCRASGSRSRTAERPASGHQGRMVAPVPPGRSGRPGRRGLDTPAILRQLRDSLRAEPLRGPGPLRGRRVQRLPADARDAHAVRGAEGGLHHLALLRLSQLLLQPRLATPGRGHPRDHDQAGGHQHGLARRQEDQETPERPGSETTGRGGRGLHGDPAAVGRGQRTSSWGRSTPGIPAACCR